MADYGDMMISRFFFRGAVFLMASGIPLSCSVEDRGSPPETGLEEWIELDWNAWEDDRGEWVEAARVFLDPSDPARLSEDTGEGAIVNGDKGDTVNLHSRFEHGDVEAHIEFMVPEGSNSGVYFQSRYEIQVFDSWGVEEPGFSDCGGIYQRWMDGEGFEGHAPRVNASRPPGEWQSLDVVFRAPRFEPDGKKVENARFERVSHNGLVVHEGVEVSGPTRASTFDDEAPAGPLMLQGDHGPVAYRNIRLRLLGVPNSGQ